jgi:hypothetical protein
VLPSRPPCSTMSKGLYRYANHGHDDSNDGAHSGHARFDGTRRKEVVPVASDTTPRPAVNTPSPAVKSRGRPRLERAVLGLRKVVAIGGARGPDGICCVGKLCTPWDLRAGCRHGDNGCRRVCGWRHPGLD